MLDVKHLLTIQAETEKVFEAINSVEGLRHWFTEKTSGGVLPGDQLTFQFNGSDGPTMRIERIIPGERIDWICSFSAHGWEGNRISFQFEAIGKACKLRFTHAGWTEQNDSYAYCNSTWGHYLDSLKSYCETGMARPYRS